MLSFLNKKSVKTSGIWYNTVLDFCWSSIKCLGDLIFNLVTSWLWKKNVVYFTKFQCQTERCSVRFCKIQANGIQESSRRCSPAFDMKNKINKLQNITELKEVYDKINLRWITWCNFALNYWVWWRYNTSKTMVMR